MIDLEKLKKGDKFYKADMNGVIECIMDDDEIQPYGSFAVKVTERDGKLLIITKEDYEHIYYTREEAIEGCKAFPSERVEQLLVDKKWLKDLFYVYKTYMTDNYVEEMRRAIEEEMDIEL
ncbi:MAG: hypothetical protein Q4P31_04455 [Andreesenia angusta]|nr:hypothetical protein [Andreesenia angusta]